jgi:dTDP-glucose pyrophosphorylase
MPANIADMLVRMNTPVREIIRAIDRSGRISIALVADAEDKLLHTLTDGDIRRGVLAGIPMDAPAERLLSVKAKTPHQTPVTAPIGTRPETLLATMQEKKVRHIPLLDKAGRPVDVAILADLLEERALPLQAVVMAGGLGSRLRPLTDDTPKPMLPVGGKPIMEHLVNRLARSGIRKINVMTCYKPEKIMEHFGDGHDFGVELNYIREEKPLGTGGALGLMKEPTEPLLVINGDIVTDINIAAMLAYHQEQEADMTVAVRQFVIKVPYGVVECSGPSVRRLSEKPQLNLLINAGIYLLEPSVTKLVQPGQRLDMTDLIQKLLDSARPVVSFPVMEYWLDIGQPADYEQAQEDLNDRE